MGMKPGVLPLHKYIRDADDPNQGGFDLRSARLGRIKSYNDLPDIWQYDNTRFVEQRRDKIERETYELAMLYEYDDELINYVEISREMYDLYLVDTEDGSYRMRNSSWLILFMAKDDEYAISMALDIHSKHDAWWDKGWRIGLIDIHIDDDLSVTYDR
jgi:hypothetical protein